MVMSNGHCLATGFPAAGEVIVDQASTRTFGLRDGRARGGGYRAASATPCAPLAL
ncbi:hypothetical protein SALBM311S_03405 [Streptomyces alboniger]